MQGIEIYSSPFCPFCHRAKALLKKKGLKYKEYNVLTAPARKREMLRRAGGRHTVPQIFIEGEGIGGCEELMTLNEEGGLDGLALSTG